MMKFLREIRRFIRSLFRSYPASPPELEDSPELEEEKERRRGMRGDFI